VTARARVEDDLTMDGVAVYLVDGQPGHRLVAEPVDLTFRSIGADQGPHVQAPTFRLTDGIARALLDALTAHYGGAPELQTLRKDYDAERARVDRMLDHLIRAGGADGH
jgi:hypothetical protein